MPPESSRPPSIDPRATLSGADESLPVKVARYREEQKATAVEVVALTDRVEALEEAVGRVPSALPGDKGSGYGQRLVDLTNAVNELRTAIDADREARKREAEEAGRLRALEEKRREPWSKATWIAIAAVISAVVGVSSAAAFHWVVTLHH